MPWLLAVALLAPAQATAAIPTLTAGPVTYAQAAAQCSYGHPQLDGDQLLIPKVCRHELQGKPVVRHSVEVKSLATGARVQQASLPPQAMPPAGLPEVGALLAGSPPLLVTAEGIAGIDLRSGRAEAAFAPEGTLAAVARRGALLAIVDRRPTEGGKGQTALEVSVLDLDAGEPVGAALFADSEVTALELAVRASGAADLRLCVREACYDMSVRAAGGQPAAKDGRLASRKGPPDKATPATTVTASTCPAVLTPASVIAGRPGVAVGASPTPVRAPSATAVGWSGTTACLALIHVERSSTEAVWLAWVDQAGARTLRSTLAAASVTPPPPPVTPVQ
jgi:hypothetical protein